MSHQQTLFILFEMTVLLLPPYFTEAAPVSDGGKDAQLVFLSLPNIDSKCNSSDWLYKMKQGCENCEREVKLLDCFFPSKSDSDGLYMMPCKIKDLNTSPHGYFLNCTALDTSSDCNVDCQLTLTPIENNTDDSKQLTSGQSVPGIAGGIMAIILLTFLVYVCCRIRQRNFEENIHRVNTI